MATSQSAPLPVQKRAWDTRERIQERAGVSRGSLLHQFPSRDDLLIAAVQHLAVQRAGLRRVPGRRPAVRA